MRKLTQNWVRNSISIQIEIELNYCFQNKVPDSFLPSLFVAECMKRDFISKIVGDFCSAVSRLGACYFSATVLRQSSRQKILIKIGASLTT